VFINTTTFLRHFSSFEGSRGEKEGKGWRGPAEIHPAKVPPCGMLGVGSVGGWRDEGREGEGEAKGVREGMLPPGLPFHLKPPERKGGEPKGKEEGGEAFEEKVVLINTGGRSCFLLLFHSLPS